MRIACLAAELSSSTALCHPSPRRWRSTFPQRRGIGRWSSPKRLRCASVNVRCYFQLIPPPYPLSALEPYMSQETVERHWGRHHREHLNSLNTHIAGSELNEMPLEEIVLASYNKGDYLPVFTHAAQTWNHDFFWQSMKPGGGGRPSGILLQLIERDFGSFELFLKEFKTAALTQFGSGWVWLTYKSNRLDVGNAVNPCPSAEDNKLVVAKTANAINPLVWDYSPLLAIDVWEHAYYLDYENQRAEYISVFMDKLVSWDFVNSRLAMAFARDEERARKDASNSEEDDLVLADSAASEMFLDSDDDGAETE